MATNNRPILRLAALATLVFALSARCELKVPRLTGRVVDQAGILSGADKSRLEERILGLERASGGQMAVLIVPSLEGDSLELFSMRVAESWKIGRKGQDTGALLLVSHKDREIRLEVGYGWEDEINDARAGDTIRGMRSFFRKQQFAQGIEFAIADVQQFVTGQRPEGTPVARRRGGKGGGGNVLFFVIAFVVISAMGGWRRRRFGFGTMIFMGVGGHSRGGGGFGGGGFSGGGGSFGGGGASGGW